MFVAVGLLGAVLAGSLAAVYYAQQVRQLTSETAAARRQLSGAVEQVSEVANEAVGAIESEVAAVRDQLAVSLPIDDPAAAGLAAVRTEVVVGDATRPQPGPSRSSPQPPRTPRRETRSASAFAVINDDGVTFFATSFALVAVPDPGVEVVERAQVTFAGQSYNATVHSWNADNDLALLRVQGLGDVTLPRWRPADDRVAAGDRTYAVGLTPGGTLTQLRATVGGVDQQAVTTDLSLPDILAGGPLLDAQGRVVAISSTAYAPFGAGGANNPSVPVRKLCEGLVNC